MKLLPAWITRLDQLPHDHAQRRESKALALPKSPEFFSDVIQFVDDEAKAVAASQLLAERSIAWIGIDTEFRYSKRPVEIRNRLKHDCRSIQPLLLSLAAVEPRGVDTKLFRFVFDLRQPEVLASLRNILSIPVPFVGHFLQAELHCLWQLDLSEPTNVWDTWAAEKVVHLGLFNGHYKLETGDDDAKQAAVHEEAGEAATASFSLTSLCRRYGVTHAFAGNKERLQESFLDFDDNAEFSPSQINYAAMDAEAAARLYLLQISKATMSGVLDHLHRIEMPWVLVNARVIWHGVRVDRDQAARVHGACGLYAESLLQQIQQHGVENPRSHKQLKEFFDAEGLLSAFKRGRKFSFDKDQLKRSRHLHPVIELIFELRRIEALERDKILLPELDGADGRVHPDHRQLGADSGRQSCSAPNLLGLDRTMRPLIIPASGCGIGEVDLCQIEVGVAGAIYGDEKLVAMFNSGDVYSAMAQQFYLDELTADEGKLPGNQFKQRHPKRRDAMKACTLGIIYGITAHGLAAQLAITKQKAEQLLDQFMAMFPALDAAAQCETVFAERRGYAVTATGLRRLRCAQGRASNWECNWFRNHPVQGSAAAAFKVGCIRLDKLYRQFDARIIVPVHDAVVFEAPLGSLEAVANVTADALCNAVQEMFPQLHPRAEINLADPSCWNKEGQSQLLNEWLEQVELHTHK